MTGLLRSRSQGRQAPARGVAQRAELIALACVAAVLLWGLFLVPLSPEPAAPAGDHGGRTLLRRSLLGARHAAGACSLSRTCWGKALLRPACCEDARGVLRARVTGAVLCLYPPRTDADLGASPSQCTHRQPPGVARRAGQLANPSLGSHGAAQQGCAGLAARPLTKPLAPRRAAAGPAPAARGRRCAAGRRGAAPALAQDAAAGRAPLARSGLPARQLAGAAAGQARAPSLPGSPSHGLLCMMPPARSAEAWAHHAGLPWCVHMLQNVGFADDEPASAFAACTGRRSAPQMPKAPFTSLLTSRRDMLWHASEQGTL